MPGRPEDGKVMLERKGSPVPPPTPFLMGRGRKQGSIRLRKFLLLYSQPRPDVLPLAHIGNVLSASLTEKGQNTGNMFVIMTLKQRPSVVLKTATDTPSAGLAGRRDRLVVRTLE